MRQAADLFQSSRWRTSCCATGANAEPRRLAGGAQRRTPELRQSAHQGASGRSTAQAQRMRPISGIQAKALPQPLSLAADCRAQSRINSAGRTQRVKTRRANPTPGETALVGLLTPELEGPWPSRCRHNPMEPGSGSSNGHTKEAGLRQNARLQRRGRPGIAPEFPVFVERSSKNRPTTNTLGGECNSDLRRCQTHP